MIMQAGFHLMWILVVLIGPLYAHGNYPINYRANCIAGDRSLECTSFAPYMCYDAFHFANCCDTCQGYKNIYGVQTPDCEYGDRDPSSCHNLTYRHCKSSVRRQRCCLTCHEILNQDVNFKAMA